MSSSSSYPTTAAPSEPQAERFFFESEGNNVITKVVEYRRILELDGRAVFNLGFGDYDPVPGHILDEVGSNNGDVYRVFATVLHTVVQFYEANPTAVLFMQGSDSQVNYVANCRISCLRNCGLHCRKADRRIATYRNFISRNLEALMLEYVFYGRGADNEPFEQFVKGREYKALLVHKRP